MHSEQKTSESLEVRYAPPNYACHRSYNQLDAARGRGGQVVKVANFKSRGSLTS